MSEEGNLESRRVERKLLIRPIPVEMLPSEGNDIDLGDKIEDRYLSEWIPASHTFHLQPDGSGLITILMERLRRDDE